MEKKKKNYRLTVCTCMVSGSARGRRGGTLLEACPSLTPRSYPAPPFVRLSANILANDIECRRGARHVCIKRVSGKGRRRRASAYCSERLGEVTASSCRCRSRCHVVRLQCRRTAAQRACTLDPGPRPGAHHCNGHPGYPGLPQRRGEASRRDIGRCALADSTSWKKN